YILILPLFGAFSDIFSNFARKRLFGYTAMVFATMLIAFLGFMVWAHHMFTVGLGRVANSIFSVDSMSIAVSTGIKMFNWLFSMLVWQVKINSAMSSSLVFIPTCKIRRMTGVMLGSAVADSPYLET